MNDEPEAGNPISHGICDRCVELALMKGTKGRRLGSTIALPFDVASRGNPGIWPRAYREEK
jgi:hypothetical protein